MELVLDGTYDHWFVIVQSFPALGKATEWEASKPARSACYIDPRGIPEANKKIYVTK